MPANLFNYYYHKFRNEQIILNYLSDKEFPKPAYMLHQSYNENGFVEISFNAYEEVINFLNNDTDIQNLFVKPITTKTLSHELSKDANWKDVKHFSVRNFEQGLK